MVQFEVNIINKTDKDKIIGADVIISDDVGNEVKRITVTDENSLEELRNYINDVDARFTSVDEVLELIQNRNETHEINATKLNGVSNYSLDNHTHQYAPLEHINKLGTSSEAGHTRVISDVENLSGNFDGEALSASVGKTIIQKLNQMETVVKKSSVTLNFGRISPSGVEDGFNNQILEVQTGKGWKISLQATMELDGSFDFSNCKAVIIINGVWYLFSMTKDGHCIRGSSKGLNINLGKGDYNTYGFLFGSQHNEIYGTMAFVIVRISG